MSASMSRLTSPRLDKYFSHILDLRIYMISAFTYLFLHPHKIIPSAEFFSDSFQPCDLMKTSRGMKIIAAVCKIFVLVFAVCGSRQKIDYTHIHQTLFQFCIKHSAYAMSAEFIFHVYRRSNSPRISFPGTVFTGIDISGYPSVFFAYKIRIFRCDLLYTLTEFLFRRRFILKRDRGIHNIVRIYPRKLSGIIFPHVTYHIIAHTVAFSLMNNDIISRYPQKYLPLYNNLIFAIRQVLSADLFLFCTNFLLWQTPFARDRE